MTFRSLETIMTKGLLEVDTYGELAMPHPAARIVQTPAEMRQRFRDALALLPGNVNLLKLGAQHVFDFEDGLRLVIFAVQEGGETRRSITSYVLPDSAIADLVECTVSPADVLAIMAQAVGEAYRDISGDSRPVHLLAIDANGMCETWFVGSVPNRFRQTEKANRPTTRRPAGFPDVEELEKASPALKAMSDRFDAILSVVPGEAIAALKAKVDRAFAKSASGVPQQYQGEIKTDATNHGRSYPYSGNGVDKV